MSDAAEKLRQIRNQKLRMWTIRQVVSACIVIPVVLIWPNWRWLLWAWPLLALLSLGATLYLMRKLSRHLEDSGSFLDSVETSDQPRNGDPDGKKAEAWNDQKCKLMESMLGPEHDHVMHAIIPFPIGGALDLYYFPKGVAGTAIATKELSNGPGVGPSNAEFTCYELVMFTRHPLNLDEAKDESTDFGRAHKLINGVLNCVARYAESDVTLNVHDTLEFPADMESVGGKCFLLAPYGARLYDTAANFGLIAVMEVHRSEMEYARRETGELMIQKLKDAGYYPYTDMDRPSLV